MKTIMCAVYDQAVEAYSRPFQAQTEADALRAFTDDVMNPESPAHRHSEHFALFQVAEFNNSTGVMTPTEPPQLIAKAHEIKATVVNLENREVS